MNSLFQTMNAVPSKADCVIIPTFYEEPPVALISLLAAGQPWLASAPAFADHDGKQGSITVCYGNASSQPNRILAVGLGHRKECTLTAIRKSIAVAMKRCCDLRAAAPALCLESIVALADACALDKAALLEEVVAAAHVSLYKCTAYKSAAAKDTDASAAFTPETLIVLHGEEAVPAWAEQAVIRAAAGVAGVCYARDLVNGPGNIITPRRMAEEAEHLAGKYGFRCRVLGQEELTAYGMGALLGVAQGSRQEPRLIVLEYIPEGKENADPLVFVGKGITFDSGGISLKPAASMHEMKGDMAGAAAVLGLFTAIGNTPSLVTERVVGVMPCAENMPSGSATRPGDILTTMSGKTVEIMNTDAEGRLILCDALTYAQKEWKPAALVDLATLTGACVVALGLHAAAVFCDSAKLRSQIIQHGEAVGETFWHMPLWDDMKDNLKSDVADIANVGAREGGAINAALYLKAFVADKIAWAHLDIAGPGFLSKGNSLCPAGGTGFGVRTLYKMVCSSHFV